VEHFVRPFDLNKAPLLRVGLIKIWGNTQILMVDMHHIISDGISHDILVRDFLALYRNETQTLTPLPIQYKDFSEWRNKEQQRESIRRQEAFLGKRI
jgi:hypothetical protein